MSTTYDKTDNYALNLYGDNDPADLRDGYNGSMRTIDTTLETHLNRIEGVEAHETHDEEVVKALLGDNTVSNATIAKTKWDIASTDATNALADTGVNSSLLTALGADTAAHANDARTRWDNKKDPLTECIFIGDSITAGYGLDSPLTERYPVFVAKGLHETPHIYAQDGAGFVAASATAPYNTLTSLADQAIADTTYDHTRVGHVFLMGGINDGLDQATQAENNAKAILSKLKQAYPNATVICGVCPTCGKSRQSNKTQYSGIGAIDRNVHALHKLQLTDIGADVVFMDCWKMLWANRDSTTDGLHPNKMGHMFFASQLLSALHGTVYEKPFALPSGIFKFYTETNQYPDRYKAAKNVVTSINGVENAGVEGVSFNNDHLQIVWTGTSVRITVKTTSNAGDVIIPIVKLPEWMNSYNGATNFSKKIILSEESFPVKLSDGSIRTVLLQFQYYRAENTIEVLFPGVTPEISPFTVYARIPATAIPIM